MQKKSSFSLLREKDLSLSSELLSWSVDSEYLGLSPGVRCQKPGVHGKVDDNHIFTTLPPQETAFSDSDKFLQVTVFQSGLELTLRHPAFPSQNKEDFQ